MKTYLIAGGVAAAALFGGAATTASAETLSVNTTVAPYCGIRLANVSSGTASVAHEAAQQVANFQLACNTGNTASLVVNPTNGDFVNNTNSSILINYAMKFDAADDAFDIDWTDATPGDVEGAGLFTRNKVGYSQPLANGLGATFWLDVNVAAPGPTAEGQTWYPANAAPAGTYSETFLFTLTAV